MVWLSDEEVESIRRCRQKEIIPGAFELQQLARRLSEEAPRQRALELLGAFRNVIPQECPDCWYTQLEHVLTVARALDDQDAMQHIALVNEAVRQASRQSVRLVRNEEEKENVRKEMRLLGESIPAGKAELSRPSATVCSPACDITEVLMQGGPLVCRRVRDAGYTLERKPIGRQGAVPSSQKLTQVKEKSVAELEKATTFISAVAAKAGVDVVAQFKAMIHERFNVDLFCARGQDGISISDLYSLLPSILERKQRGCKGLLWELQARFMAFRIDFGTMCSPLEDYMPIFEAIFQLFRYADAEIMKEHGTGVLSMFRGIFAIVLDLLAGSVEALTKAMGAGLGVLMGAVGVGAAEAAGAAAALGIGSATAFVGGALACGLAVRSVVHLVDRWVKYGKHVRISALFRRSDAILFRVWVVELMQ